MRILLTGGSGFVGRHLVPLLEKSGHELVHLVRAPKGLPNEVVWNFKGPLPSIPFCDAVIHLAAVVDFGKEFHITQYQVNTVSTMHLAAYAKQQQSYFVLTSTIGVHGSLATRIDRETPLAPDNSYAISKYLAEEAVKAMAVDYTILRIAGIYGLDGPTHLGLNTAISNAFHRGEPPTLKGSGKAKRNYICVTDVAQWIAALVEQHWKTGHDVSNTIYLASPEALSIEEYLRTIVDILISGKDIIYKDGERGGGRDMIVNGAPAPFCMLRFEQYLQSLKINKQTAIV